jgi:hypothetical protein
MNYDDTVYCSGKVISEREEEIVRVAPLDELRRTTTMLSFRHPIVTLFETESKTRMSIDGETISEGSTHNDHYGFFTSCQDLLPSMAGSKKFVPGRMTGEIFTTLKTLRYSRDIRKIELSVYRADQRFRSLPRDWIIVGEGLNSRESIEKWATTPWDERFDIAPEHANEAKDETIVLWTSEDTWDGNRKRYDDLVQRFLDMEIVTPEWAEGMRAGYIEAMSPFRPTE